VNQETTPPLLRSHIKLMREKRAGRTGVTGVQLVWVPVKDAKAPGEHHGSRYFAVLCEDELDDVLAKARRYAADKGLDLSQRRGGKPRPGLASRRSYTGHGSVIVQWVANTYVDAMYLYTCWPDARLKCGIGTCRRSVEEHGIAVALDMVLESLRNHRPELAATIDRDAVLANIERAYRDGRTVAGSKTRRSDRQAVPPASTHQTAA
jgi:hypothetical protein